MTTRDDLHRLVDNLPDEAADELFEYAQWLAGDGDALTGEELTRVREGQAAIAAGDFVTLEEARRQLGL